MEKEKVRKKAKKERKKAGFTAFLLLCCVFLLFGGLFSIFMLNFNDIRPVEVKFLDADGHVYVVAQANDNFLGYRFSFESGKDSFKVDSQECILDISSLEDINYNTTYYVSVCYIAEIEGASTAYSKPVRWPAYTYLDSPKLSQDDLTIFWDAVPNADSYLIYSPTNAFESFVRFTTSVDKSLLPAGKYQVEVIACSSSHASHYQASLKAGSIEIENHLTLSTFEKVSYNAGNRKIEVTSAFETKLIQIEIDGTKYIAKDFESAMRQGKHIYTIDISAVVKNVNRIGARAYIDNEYVTLSEFVYSNT